LYNKKSTLKHLITNICLAIGIFMALNSNGQVNRRNSKRPGANNYNYQTLVSSPTARYTYLIKNGLLVGWGYNNNGQIGNGDTSSQQTTALTIPSDSTWSTVAVGGYHNLALKTDGSLWGWGLNEYGQLGDSVLYERSTPFKLGEDTAFWVSSTKWVDVSVSSTASHAIRYDGTLWGWGWNFYGQIGNNADSTEWWGPVKVGIDSNWVNIVSGQFHTLGLKSDGTLWAWGRNVNGQIGDGTDTIRYVPVQVGNDNKWVNIAAGNAHTLGLKSDGTLWSWGLNTYGQLGNGNFNDQHIPVQVGSDNKWVDIAAGNAHSIGLKSDGTLWTWGLNIFGQLGIGNNTNISENTPVQVGLDNNWTNITAGFYHSVAIKSNGSVWGWGENIYSELNKPTDTTIISSPVQILENKSPQWAEVASGDNHNISLKSNGTLWGWGANNVGQLGDGTDSSRTSYIQIGNDTNWVSASTGGAHSFGIKSNGTLWGWGYNSSGQLGDGTDSSRNQPVQIGIDNQWVTLIGGEKHSLGLKSNGTLWAWGDNTFGQLGNGSNTSSNTPVQITGNAWVSIAAGNSHSLGLQSDGSLWAWGNNSNGQLGNNSTSNSNTPQKIGSNNNWISIAAGDFHNLALQFEGTLWTWGKNTQGQLGNNNTSDQYSPTLIGSDSTWLLVDAGGAHSHAIKANGTLWSWGNNSNGGLGTGDTLLKNAPTQIGADTNWVYISAGSLHTVALNSIRNQFCASGYNAYGQLGNSSTIDGWVFNCEKNITIQTYIPTAIINNFIDTKPLLSVYPNPNNGNITIQSSTDGNFTIINELGQTIQRISLNSSNNFTQKIDGLPNGLLLVVGTNNGRSVNQKVVVLR